MNTITTELVTPFLDDFRHGRINQTEIAKKLGVKQRTLSAFMGRNFGHGIVPRGGIFPTSEAMLQAVEEAMPGSANTAKVAKKYGVDYLALYRRVQKRRAEIEKVLASV